MAKHRDLLEKAISIAKRQGNTALETVKGFPAHNKIGLGLGFTSLGLGINNTIDNKRRSAKQQAKLDLEAKSLNALNKIHKALEKKDEQ